MMIKISELVKFCRYMGRNLDDVSVEEQNGKIVIYVNNGICNGKEISPSLFTELQVIYLAENMVEHNGVKNEDFYFS